VRSLMHDTVVLAAKKKLERPSRKARAQGL
jgi:hypothetical protein